MSGSYLEWRKDESLNPPWVLLLVDPGRDPIPLVCVETPMRVRGPSSEPIISNEQFFRETLEKIAAFKKDPHGNFIWVAARIAQDALDTRPAAETASAPFPYPTDRDGWICSVCHGWNVPKDRACMHSHLPR